MSTHKYIRIIKETIDAEAKKARAETKSPDESFFNNLFPHIKDKVKTVAKALSYPTVDDATLESYFQTARKEYLSINPIDIEVASSLTKAGFETWLTQARMEKTPWNYTGRYIKYLEKAGRSELVIKRTKTSSLDIMGKLGDPKSSESFYTKGLSLIHISEPTRPY